MVFAICAVNAVGCATVNASEAIHPLLSVTVTEYVPVAKEKMSSDVAPVFQAYVNEPCPPVTSMSMFPELSQLQIAGSTVDVMAIGNNVSIAVSNTPTHPFASRTIAE